MLCLFSSLLLPARVYFQSSATCSIISFPILSHISHTVSACGLGFSESCPRFQSLKPICIHLKMIDSAAHKEQPNSTLTSDRQPRLFVVHPNLTSHIPQERRRLKWLDTLPNKKSSIMMERRYFPAPLRRHASQPNPKIPTRCFEHMLSYCCLCLHFPNILSPFSTNHMTASFFILVSLSSRLTLSGRMIVGANTTATFMLVMRLSFSCSTTRARCPMR